jgi:hypothetical protein
MDRDHSSLIIILLGGMGSRWWSSRLRCSSATYVASVGKVSRGYFTSFYGPPTLEFLWFLALLPTVLSTMPVAALMSALGKFRFIGSRPRLCSWARYCGGLRISLSDGGSPALRLHHAFARANKLATDFACHRPPRGVLTPRVLRRENRRLWNSRPAC